MLRRRNPLLLAACLIAMAPYPLSAEDASETGRFEDGTTFPFHDLVELWATMTPESEAWADDLPLGSVRPVKVYVQKPFGAREGKPINPKTAALLEKKLKIALQALIEQPPLKNLRGFDINSRIDIYQNRFGFVGATLEIWPTLENLAEFTQIRISFNSDMPWSEPTSVQFKGTYRSSSIAKITHPIVYAVNSERDITVIVPNGYGGQIVANPNFYDRTQPQTKIQFLAGSVALSSLSNLYSSDMNPLSGGARVVAALFMANWPEVIQRMEQVGN